jgi:hypothetical protein
VSTQERVPGRAEGRLLHRCGGWHGSSSTCPCQLDRHTLGPATTARVPDSVHAVLSTPGEAVDEATRERLGARLGHHFGDVRLHTDARSARSARDVDAAAYTVGQHVVLDPGRVPHTGQARDQVLAHELVHTLQNAAARGGRAYGPGGDAVQGISHPDAPREREAEAVSGQATRGEAAGSRARDGAGARSPVAPTPGILHRQPAPPSLAQPDVGLGLTFREDGRVEVVASGPNLPVVGNPAVGLRRNADGTWELLAGGTKKTVSASEVPALLRSFAAGSKPGAKTQLKVPSCRQLMGVDGRPRPYLDYKVNASLWPDTVPLTPDLYEVMTAACRPKDTPTVPPLELPHVPPAELQDLPEPSLPEGQAYA